MSYRLAKALSLSLVTLHAIATAANAVPLLVDFGPNKVVTGVYTNADGSTLLTGYSVEPGSGTRQGLLISVSSDGASFVTQSLGSAGSSSFEADKIKGDYLVGWGKLGASEIGLAWNISDLSNPLVTQSFQDPGASNLTRNADVNSSGNFTGDSGAGRFATLGSIPTNTAVQLTSPGGSLAGGNAISDQNYIAGVISPFASNSILPVVWTSESSYVILPTSLAAGGTSQAYAASISDSGKLVGGSVGIFDTISETIKFQAAVWSGNGWADAVFLTNSDGTPFYGEVLGVTDDGYAVGKSEQGGFIWNLAWANPILFNTWAQDALGLTIPTWVTSVNDIFSDGSGLSFALQGSAYLVRTESGTSQSVPEPSTIAILLVGLILATAYRQAATPIVQRKDVRN